MKNLQRYEKPFPYTVIENYLDANTVRAINAEWPEGGWYKEDGRAQKKWNQPTLTPTAQAVVDAVDLSLVEQVTGISGLIADPELAGGGLHCIPRGGFLNMHCDFNIHENGWHRRVNMLVYLNEDWSPEWGGALQLGRHKHDCAKIDPAGGRCVIFETNDQTWHGHPEPLACPADRQRRSLAMYFYTPENPGVDRHTTIYIK